MFTTHQKQGPRNGTWALLALATGLFLTSLLRADVRDGVKAPERLSASVGPRCSPCQQGKRPRSPEARLADTLWVAVDAHESGHLETAIPAWNEADLAPGVEVWRWLGEGVARLDMDQLEEAEQGLLKARNLEPKNAAVHYFFGLLKLKQAERADEYLDGRHPPRLRLVSNPARHPANSLSLSKCSLRYELEAMYELERAIAVAPSLDTTMPLAPARWVVHAVYPAHTPVTPPDVADLLHALGADNFVGKAHGLLAQLCLDHNQTERAEQHIDESVARGVPVPYGYRTVGEQYAEVGRCADARRANLKALAEGDVLAKPGRSIAGNMQAAFEDLFQAARYVPHEPIPTCSCAVPFRP